MFYLFRLGDYSTLNIILTSIIVWYRSRLLKLTKRYLIRHLFICFFYSFSTKPTRKWWEMRVFCLSFDWIIQNIKTAYYSAYQMIFNRPSLFYIISARLGRKWWETQVFIGWRKIKTNRISLEIPNVREIECYIHLEDTAKWT